MSRKKGDRADDRSVQKLREKAAQIAYQIGEKRDQLREIVGEFEDILTSTVPPMSVV